MAEKSLNVTRKPFGWKTRHFIILLLGILLTYGLLESRAQWSGMHRWNRALGDASVLLVAFSMMIGPLSRLWPAAKRLVPWRRELGIYGVIAAFIHATIILVGWMEWDLFRLIGMEWHPGLQRYVMFQHGLGFANILGLAALIYALVLALTSNDRSQRWLGASVWKHVQQGTYIMWWIIVLHTGYFLFMHFLDYHRSAPDPNWFRWPFVGLVVLVMLLQFAASIKTWRLKNKGAAAFS
ncbi:MAG: ferric reductase-like transmembrane domain-containing protein [Rhodobacteraceae bacterium]|nr:ferric reductase-like transmembrane domain-containing protein [Paracoccaceae bacterium]